MTEDITRRVLVVDDDPQSLQFVQLLLEKRGFTVTCAHSAEDALEIVNREDILVVMTDIYMPGMNGIELLREIKKARGIIQVIMVTASDDLELLLKALEGGADDFLLKPLDHERIAEALEAASARVTRWRNTMRELFAKMG